MLVRPDRRLTTVRSNMKETETNERLHGRLLFEFTTDVNYAEPTYHAPIIGNSIPKRSPKENIIEIRRRGIK
jgi:hypothetical protein